MEDDAKRRTLCEVGFKEGDPLRLFRKGDLLGRWVGGWVGGWVVEQEEEEDRWVGG